MTLLMKTSHLGCWVNEPVCAQFPCLLDKDVGLVNRRRTSVGCVFAHTHVVGGKEWRKHFAG